MKEWKRAAACVCAAVLICYSIIMGLVSNSLTGFVIPLLCVAGCVILCVILRKLPGIRGAEKIQLILEGGIVVIAAACMILFV